MQRLWGDNYYDAANKKWKKQDESGLRRAFCAFIMDPILRVCKTCMSGDRETLDKILGSLDITMSSEERQ